ncbi:MAG: hypothetical protein KatS3mg008_0248 [Acidimicrobiales bacterium]|nr:MAG: hypothetical protein KatS3mg008_0248 [Acidimicrobiales bacterium]
MRRLLAVVSSLAVSLGSVYVARELDRQGRASPSPSSAASVKTPVLSVRRVPLWLSMPTGVRALRIGLDAVVADASPKSCLVVRDGERVLHEARPDTPLIPASNQKLLVAFAVLEAFDPGERLTTRVVTEKAPQGATIEGDLWLVGGGDPLLSTPDYLESFEVDQPVATDFTRLADEIVKRGVRRIEGRILGDESRHDARRTVESWPSRSLGRTRPGPLSALMVNDGFEQWPSSPDSDAIPVPASSPARHAASVLRELLRERGVQVVGGVGEGKAPAGAVSVAEIQSPPIADIVRQMLTQSDNTTAEVLLKELGLRREQSGSTRAGLDALIAALTEAGLPMDGVVLMDGSGLDDGNRVTCRLLASLLVQDGPDGPIARALPVAGESGTLRSRFRESIAEGRVSAKTGLLREATALSGFARTVGGFDLAFSWIENDDFVDEEELSSQQRLVETLVRFPEAPPLERIGPRR